MKHLLLLIFALALLASNAFAQCTIRGKVTDHLGEPIPGAAVMEKNNTGNGVFTDFDGLYSIELAVGPDKSLIFSFYGLLTQEIIIPLKEGEVITQDVTLVPEDQEMGPVIIEAKANRATTGFMEIKKRNAAVNMDYISSDLMKKSGDPTVTNAVRRIPGVSTVGGYITVRGLADRYIKTNVNGMRIPTLDPFTNNIKLDIFPTGLIDNVVITKTASPDLPGDWSGAYLSVETKDYPDELSIEWSTSLGYNSQSTFKNIVSSEGSPTDWLGYDNGYRDIPDGIPTTQDEYPIPVTNPTYYQQFNSLGLGSYLNSYGITNNTSIEEGDAFYQLAMVELGLLGPAQFYNEGAVNDAIESYNDQYSHTFFPLFNAKLAGYGQSFKNNWFTVEKKAPLNLSNSLTIGNQTTLFKRKFGYIVGFRHYNNTNYDPASAIRRTNEGPDFVPTEEFPEPIADQLSMDQRTSQETSGWSGLINLAYRLNPNNNIAFMFMPNFLGENSARRYQGNDDNSSAQELIFGHGQLYEERKQLIYQLKTDHYLPKSKSKIELNASYTNGERNILDFKDVEYLYDKVSRINIFRSTFAPDRRYRFMDEKLLDSSLGIEIPLGEKEINPTKLKLGGAYQYNEREGSQVIYRMEGASGDEITTEDLNSIFTSDRFSVEGKEGFDLKYVNASVLLDSDVGFSTVISGYGLIDHRLMPKLRFLGGLRVEHTDILADIANYHELGLAEDDPQRASIGGQLAKPSIIDTMNFLPSGNFIYNLVATDTTAINLRLSYFQSIARPGFRELSAVSLDDYELRARVQGNVDLQMTSIQNFDFRAESYFASGDNIFFSVFYKQFKNHIELVQVPGGAVFTWDNADNSRALGIELEGKKRITDNLDLRANISLIDSKTTVTVPVTETRKMFGQSPYILNGMLTYTGDSARFTASVSYNVQGPKIAVVATAGADEPDIFELPRHMIDLTVSQKFGKHFALGLSARNLLNAPIRRTYKFDAGWLLDFDKYTYGTNYSFTFTYKL